MKKLFLILVTAMFSVTVLACTNVFWASDKGVVVNRTMDWPLSTEPVLVAYNDGKYKLLAITLVGMVGEGVNEKGLQGSALYYSKMRLPVLKDAQVTQVNLLEYLLSNYATVQEVANNIRELKVAFSEYPALPAPPLGHYILTDKSGDRILLQYNETGLAIYRGEDAKVVTNTEQQGNLSAWKEVTASVIKQGGPDMKVKMEMGNTDSVQRFIYSNYYLGQLKDTHSALYSMMALEGVSFKIPQQAAYRPNTGFDTYQTEYSVVYNLETGDVVFKYSGLNHWKQESWNFYELIGTDINRKLYK